MGKKRMPKSLRKFIRKEKARIRREILSIEDQNKLISELYQKISKDATKYEKNTNIRKGKN